MKNLGLILSMIDGAAGSLVTVTATAVALASGSNPVSKLVWITLGLSAAAGAIYNGAKAGLAFLKLPEVKP